MATGSFERALYDPSTYQADLDTNNRRINLIMSNPGVCNDCRVPEPGFLTGQGVSIDPNRSLMDVESDLLNLGRLYNRGVGGYKPYCPELINTNLGDGLPCGGGVSKGPLKSQPLLKHLPECRFNQIDSRIDEPPCSFRELGYDRWDPLCQNPQEWSAINFPGESGIQYRQALKDSWIPCLLKPQDQTPSLPPNSGDPPCIKLSGSTCAVFTGDLEPDRFTQPYPMGYAHQ